MASSEQQTSKEQFFADLYALDDLASKEEGEHSPRSDPQSIPPRMPAPKNTILKPPSLEPNESRYSRHALAVVSLDNARSAFSELLEKAPRKPSVQRGSEPERPITRLSHKAKSKNKIKPMSEEDQIFVGQTFYFIPNNDNAVPRKRRIEKALEFGAVWAQSWSKNVTYVIADSNLSRQDVTKALDGYEKDHVNLVNENWLTESVGRKDMRDPTVARFRTWNDPPETTASYSRGVQAAISHRTPEKSKSPDLESEDLAPSDGTDFNAAPATKLTQQWQSHERDILTKSCKK